MDCPMYYADEEEEKQYRIAFLAREITGYEMEYPHLFPYPLPKPVREPLLFRAKEEQSEPEEEKEEELEPRLTGILKKPHPDDVTKPPKSVSFAANTVHKESTKTRKSKRRIRRNIVAQRNLCGPFSRLPTPSYDPISNPKLIKQLERMFSAFQPRLKILNPAIVEVKNGEKLEFDVPIEKFKKKEEPPKVEEVIEMKMEEVLDEKAFEEQANSSNGRKSPVSQELHLPIGATNNWKLWTKEQVLQWSSTFLDAPSFIRKMRKLGLNGETLEYLVESKEWKDVDLSFHMYAQLRMNLNKVINDFNGL